jgi:LuxR family maltose regulon positive regulatory protein
MAFRLRLGEREVASGWAATSGITLDEPFRFTRVEAYLSIGRILVACHPPERAVAWLDRLETLLTERGLNRWLITTHILQALARSYQGAQRQALDHLVRALTLASPEGFCRAFLDEDARVLSMLPAVRAVAPAFVDDLLSFTQLPAPRAQPLVEPLSSRELEVLALMADGLSNHDIAGRLFITPGTAKRHVHSILGKLDAANRTQAVIRAQELGIL